MASVTESRLSVPVVLAVIAGGLMLVGGIISFGMAAWFHAMFGGHRMLGMMMYGGLQYVPVLVSPWLVGISLAAIGLGAAILYCSFKMHTVPQRIGPYGLAVLVFSIAGLFVGSGFMIGSILGIIAGIVAVSRR